MTKTEQVIKRFGATQTIGETNVTVDYPKESMPNLLIPRADWDLTSSDKAKDHEVAKNVRVHYNQYR